ncbi:MAG TPA: hypothetical protein VFD98_13440 [Terracidiphilus sp.]|jgi:hypothetical protein|nr:hypothetical protein [Terracidiphilus sp.]
MNFWQQILLSQASAALHAIILAFGSKYFTPQELTAAGVVTDALIDLPRRIHEGQAPVAPTFEISNVNLPVKRGRRKSAK